MQVIFRYCLLSAAVFACMYTLIGCGGMIEDQERGDLQENGESDGSDDSGVGSNSSDASGDVLTVDAGVDSAVDGPVPGNGFIAYVGCSQARNDIIGYEKSDPNWINPDDSVGREAGTRLHSYETGGGIIFAWKSNSSYFNAYDDEIALHGTPEAVWFQICLRSQDVGVTSYQDVKDVLSMIRSRHMDAYPEGIDVYVSGLEFFEPAELCVKSGDAANVQSRKWADDLAAENLAFRGPDLGPLTAELTSDNCHPNEQGGLLTGGQLHDFFN